MHLPPKIQFEIACVLVALARILGKCSFENVEQPGMN
jgi:hypothetical protein